MNERANTGLLLGWGFALWFRRSGQKETDTKAQDDRLNKIDVEIALLRYQAKRRWNGETLINDLHHPHPEYAEMDGLLEKLDNGGVTAEEERRLKELLEARFADAGPNIATSERESTRKLWNVLNGGWR